MEIESGRHCEYDNDTITVLAMLAMIRCLLCVMWVGVRYIMHEWIMMACDLYNSRLTSVL